MNLLARLFKKQKTVDENLLFEYNELVKGKDFVLSKINMISKNITNLHDLRTKADKLNRIETCNVIRNYIKDIDFLYNKSYLQGLAQYIRLCKRNKYVSPDYNYYLQLGLETKKELRQKFEKIYIKFKKVSKSLEDIPMNQICSEMRKAFDFANKTRDKINNWYN